MKSCFIFPLFTVAFGVNFITPDRIEEELSNYFLQLATCDFSHSATCFYLVKETGIIKHLIFRNSNCRIVTGNSESLCQNIVTIDFNVHNVYVFADSEEDLIKSVDCLVENPVWNVQVRTYFIVMMDLEDYISVLEYIWRKGIVNFVLVFVGDKLEIYTYNGFNQQKVKSIPKTNFCDEIFPDKSKDMKGNVLRVALHEHFPMVYKENGVFKGKDIKIMHFIAEDVLKMTVRIIEKNDMNSSIGALREDGADIDFIGLFQAFYFPNLDYSYPTGREDRVIVVPTPRKVPEYENLLYMFDSPLYLMVLIVIGVLPVVLFLLERRIGLLESYRIVWQILLVGSTETFLKIERNAKKLLMVWIWCSLVLNVSFQTDLYHSFISSKYTDRIESIQDLKSSGLTVYVPEYYSHYVKVLGFENIVETKGFGPIMTLMGNKTNAAFMVPDSTAKFYMEQFAGSGELIYEPLKAIILPGLKVLHLRKNSPYLVGVNRGLFLLQESGLMNRNVFRYRFEGSMESQYLGMKHFKVVFYFLLAGMAMGFAVFLLELYINGKFAIF